MQTGEAPRRPKPSGCERHPCQARMHEITKGRGCVRPLWAHPSPGRRRSAGYQRRIAGRERNHCRYRRHQGLRRQLTHRAGGDGGGRSPRHPAQDTLPSGMQSVRARAGRIAAGGCRSTANDSGHQRLNRRRCNGHPQRQCKPHQNPPGQCVRATQGLQQHGANYETKPPARTSAKSGNP